ncbi:MAG: diacylglycerol kinase [Marinosulfonomonas sp.]|nr:MAG: diacylglycerol kinase [Marinosulfonomonas sp.]
MLKREWDRFKDRALWSWAGWLDCWRNEPSLHMWTWVNVASAGFALALDITSMERALILSLGILVLAAELMNTGIERAVDYISRNEHPLAKQAKDAASAGVAVTAIAAGVAWLAILVG